MIQAPVKYPPDYDQWHAASVGFIQFENDASRDQFGELDDNGHLTPDANPTAKQRDQDILSIFELDSAGQF
eukprot:1794768-Pyramimonas_sp.AAC.2